MFMQRKYAVEELEVAIELDGRPGCDPRLVSKVIDNSKNKVYDRINVSCYGRIKSVYSAVYVGYHLSSV